MPETTYSPLKAKEAPHPVQGLLRLIPLAQVFADALDLLFPPRCVHCGRVDTAWCMHCQRQLDVLPTPLLPSHASVLAGCAAMGVHQGQWQEVVHALKYENTRALADPVGRRLANCVQALGWTFDLVLPVPIGAERLKERGYNQAGLIAQACARVCDVRYEAHALRRTRETRSQVGLGGQGRKENIAGAFVADGELARGQSCLVIDDVYTTGATLTACAEALLAAGATSVRALTVTVAHD
jgi:ComF family protein